jgi:hypothetical protein
MSIEITNDKDVIDTRNIVERIEDLKEDEDRSSDDDAELNRLRTLLVELAEHFGDAEVFGGIALVHDDYFTEYAREYAADSDILGGKENWDWPYNHIDWDAAADELRQDYSAIDFDGVRYWGRD